MDVWCLTQWTLHSQICSTLRLCVCFYTATSRTKKCVSCYLFLLRPLCVLLIFSHLYSLSNIIYLCVECELFSYLWIFATRQSALNQYSLSVCSLCLLLFFAPKVPFNNKKNLKQRSVSVDREAADDGNLEEPLKLRRPKEHVEGKPGASRAEFIYTRIRNTPKTSKFLNHFEQKKFVTNRDAWKWQNLYTMAQIEHFLALYTTNN